MKFIRSLGGSFKHFLWNDSEQVMHNKELFLLQFLFSHNTQKVQANIDSETVRL